MRSSTNNSITKTTAITNSKRSINSGPGVSDINTNVNVNLPKIKGNRKYLASIDDDNEEDYDDRVPQKPRNVHLDTPSDDDANHL